MIRVDDYTRRRMQAARQARLAGRNAAAAELLRVLLRLKPGPPPKHPDAWTHEQTLRMLRLVSAGASVTEVAAGMQTIRPGVTAHRVSSRLSALLSKLCGDA